MAGKQAKRHGRDFLYSAHSKDGIRTAEIGSINNRRIDAFARLRRRARNDMIHTRSLGGSNRHNGRCHMRITPTRHITTRGLNRDLLLACKQSRGELDFKIDQCRSLFFGKPAYAIIGELNVVLHLLREFCGGGFDFFRGDNDVAAVT